MSYEDHQGPLNLDDEVSELTPERVEIALRRALRKLDYPCPLELSDIDIPGNDDEDFMIAFAHELKLMVITDHVQEMVAAGLLEPDGVYEDGEVRYKPTQLGREIMGMDE